ncbi:DEAD/DEAH box helicase, putative [Angomonas deanei]|uniref:DEAD/DEAH box helicase, putative n=1 Tax=Angomonas deanei TaxID=59799 RepID=A0A7G2CKA6_9TRYP|nr:DEAD/DEAH box helicase, putative [Angomonas deanei]
MPQDWSNLFNNNNNNNVNTTSIFPTDFPTNNVNYNNNGNGNKFSWENYDLQQHSEAFSREALEHTEAVVLPVNPKGQYDNEQFPWSSALRRAMRDVFGLHEYRFCQLEVMNAIMSERDVFVLLPTGGGKSLCYQLPALMPPRPMVTIVFSPLISLIQDQVYSLTANDIPRRQPHRTDLRDDPARALRGVVQWQH